jgi:hypothetical protein
MSLCEIVRSLNSLTELKRLVLVISLSCQYILIYYVQACFE